MSKPVVYFLFISKVLFSLILIFWTVYMVVQSAVGTDDDDSFLSNYHYVDEHYNDIMISNQNFAKKYNIKFFINDTQIDGLITKDIFLSQRAIKDRKTRKNLLHLGDNSFKYIIFTKDGQEVATKSVGNFLITMSVSHDHDVKLQIGSKKVQQFNIKSKGYWNITGTVEIGNQKGYIFLKTDAR
jgi:hypothetical protein